MFSDDDTVLISALEHFSYCPRQCALIHVEQVFDENIFTLKGRYSHERVDSGTGSVERGVRIERALPLWSYEKGMIGKSDAIEFHESGAVVPVEYKSGPRRPNMHDDLQLCAQALCLEEMFSIRVERGAIYSIQSRRRREVIFDEELREQTCAAVRGVRALMNSTGPLPPAVNDERCRHCSLFNACVPATIVKAREQKLRQQLYDVPSNDFYEV